jgi:hypothetical protein
MIKINPSKITIEQVVITSTTFSRITKINPPKIKIELGIIKNTTFSPHVKI